VFPIQKREFAAGCTKGRAAQQSAPAGCTKGPAAQQNGLLGCTKRLAGGLHNRAGWWCYV